jgi:Ca2+-binding EF-hand superfamily protein
MANKQGYPVVTKFILFSTVALLALAGCATMRDVNPFGPGRVFNDLDQDANGMISQAEAAQEPALARAFARLDTNRDGNLSPKEYQAATLNVARGMNFEQVDHNRDGVISKQEADATPLSLREAFDRVDADGDDNISPVEYQAATTNLLQSANFQDLDTDGDGVLSKDETAKAIILRDDLDRLDADGDGWISREEFVAAQR